MSDPSLATVESTTVPDAESSAAVAASMAQAEALAAVDAMASAVAAATAEAMATPPAATAKRTRSTNLTHEQKRLICLYAKQHPTATQAQLGKWAQAQFSLACVPSQSSISHTLKKRHAFEHMKSEDWSSKRLRTVKYPELDTALANWFLYCQARQVRIQGDEIKAKAQLFFELLQLDVQATGSAEPPQFSNGWLHSFQSRHGFSRSPNTHPHSSDHELITSRAELVEATRAFAPWDVFWMDETKLSIALDPHGFGDEAEAEADAVDRQMTVAFCCNTDGSELLDPFFICDGPLDFGATSDSPAAASSATAASSAASHAVEYGFTYAYNKKIWMTPTLFREWLLSFDWKMHEENRHVVLLLDAFSSHQVKKLTLKNVTVRFVAQTPFGESYLDSVEHTLLAAVKRRYRRLHLTSAVAGKEDLSPPINYDVSVVQAIQWVLASWRDVPRALVADAFAQVGLPTTDELTAATSNTTTTTTTPASVLETEQQVEAELTVLLTTKLQVKPPIRLSEFISPVSERILDEDFTDQDFVDCAMDSCLSTAVAGRNAEPPRKIARVSRVTKPKPFHGGAGGFAARGLGAGRPPTAAMRMVSADDLTAAASAVPDEEWQAWADSQRFRIDELHALETVVRLAAEMNCEPTTMVDLARMQAELMQKRQPVAAGGVLAAGATPTDVAATATAAAATDGKQAASVCRFNFGAGSTVV